MPRQNIIIDDFSVGEVSPLNEARLASTEFRDGLRELTNMAPDSHGPLMGRPGFEFIDVVNGPEEANNITLFEITITQSTYYVVALLHERVVVWDFDGDIILDQALVATDEQLHGADGNQHLTHAEHEPGAYNLVIVNPSFPPARVIFDPDANTATFEEITFTAPPWTDEKDYPTTVTFFQGRSWWARGRIIWSSKSNFYYDMTAGSAADDAIVFEVARFGDIKWLEGNRNLLFGSDQHEFIATSESGVLQPGDMRVDIQTSYGSSWVQPVQVANEVVFLTDDFRKVRSMWYRILESGGWTSGDLTFSAEHITRDLVTQMCYARNPYSIIFCVLTTGDIVCCDYFRQENGNPSIGWYRMHNDLLDFKSVCAPERVGRSELWAAAKDPETPGRFRIMKKRMRDYEDLNEVFLDNYQRSPGDSPTYTPVFNYNGFVTPTVDVIADGFHYPEMTVQPNGQLQLPNQHTVIYAGHPYSQKFKTMPMIAKGEGAHIGHQKKRWNKVFLRTLKSYRPLVNGLRPPERHVETNDDTAEPLVDGFIRVVNSGTWERDGIIEVEQDLPFRLLLTGIYGEFSAEQI